MALVADLFYPTKKTATGYPITTAVRQDRATTCRGRCQVTQRSLHAIIISVGVVSASPTLAWGPEGHALVGKIADALLAGTNAGQHVDMALGAYTLEQAAKWPDCV